MHSVTQRPSPLWLRSFDSGFDIVVIAASAGGIAALGHMLPLLPSHFPGAILIAHHRSRGPLSVYSRMIQRRTCLPVVEARAGQSILGGVVYVAPPAHHLLVSDLETLDTMPAGPHERSSPRADLLFTTAAARYGSRCVAVVLSGYGRDGEAGVRAVRAAGGFVIAQDEDTCEQIGMPSAATETRRVDLVLSPPKIAFALETLFEPRS